MNIRSRYGDRKQVGLDCSADKGKTRQDMKDECDINLILKGFGVTGRMDHVMRTPGEYGFASSIDLQESLAIVQKADAVFNELPSQLRRRFANSPAEFLAFVQDKKNEKELYAMGLMKKGEVVPDPPKSNPVT
nr:MAG: internal scaffolding protein [Microvirus sp.]